MRRYLHGIRARVISSWCMLKMVRSAGVGGVMCVARPAGLIIVCCWCIRSKLTSPRKHTIFTMQRWTLLLLCVVQSTVSFENMNGKYTTTPTPNATGHFNTNWNEYPNGGVEYFEVYLGPMKTLYSQVWWSSVPTVPLPPDLVKRFEGKGMAIVGYETDSVRRTDSGDVSVPINMAYNHHHDVYLTGNHSEMRKIKYDPLDLTIPQMARSDPEFLEVAVETSPSPNSLPTSLHLADGNGGEYRKSYHGFAAPVAYVIDSPQSVYCNPMFIDTWNRDQMNISGGSKFVAGPLPRHSLAPPNAPYSGLLECPLTSRIQKIFPGGNNGFNSTYPPTLFDCNSKVTSCAHEIGSAIECFDAAQTAVGNATLQISEGPSDTMPPGCSIMYDGTRLALVLRCYSSVLGRKVLPLHWLIFI